MSHALQEAIRRRCENAWRRVAFFYIVMKRLLLALSVGVLSTTVHAQQQQPEQSSTLSTVVNTLKQRITLEGYLQLGYTYQDGSEGSSNTFEVKRAILMARGRIIDRWTCYFMFSCANSPKVLEAYTEYTIVPGLTVRVGQFKTMYSFENPLSPSVLELINCNSQAVNYLAGYDGSDPLYGSHTGRDLGAMLYGTVLDGWLDYNLALMNGQGINRKDGNKRKDVVGSLKMHPTEWLTVGGTFVKGRGCAVAESAVNPDIKTGQSYRRDRWSAGAMLKSRYLDLRTEYLRGRDGRVRSEGVYATVSAHVLPRVDIVASYDYFNRNRADADNGQTNYVAGLQWWFYPKCRLQVQYTRRVPRAFEASNLVQTQVQVRF